MSLFLKQVPTFWRQALANIALRRKIFIFGLPGLLIAIPAFYLLASVIGALIPGTIETGAGKTTPGDTRQIYLLTSPLHADIAIPVDEDVLNRFGFLAQSGIEIDHPGLQYLVFGWGSREFYTTAGSYSDITVSATIKAITGDRSVMHVVPSGKIGKSDNSIAINVGSAGFSKLLVFLRRSFINDDSGAPIWLEGESHGYGDVFYQGVGDFNIFKPCNVWTGKALKIAGIQAGSWTPTTYGLKSALSIHQN